MTAPVLEPGTITAHEVAALAKSIDRLAQAIEQGALAFMDARRPVAEPLTDLLEPDPLDGFVPGPANGSRPTPPVYVAPEPPAAPLGTCPIHNTAWRMVPAGVSSRTGAAYDAFWACSTKGCNQRPPRGHR